jgi:hypothetical protein
MTKHGKHDTKVTVVLLEHPWEPSEELGRVLGPRAGQDGRVRQIVVTKAVTAVTAMIAVISNRDEVTYSGSAGSSKHNAAAPT